MALVPEEESRTKGTFQSIGVCRELQKACAELKYERPTRIQALAIPWALKGKDIIGISQTGSGKTASYAIPILQGLLDLKEKQRSLKALVLCPTRELSKQVAAHFDLLGKSIGAITVSIVGGEDMSEQALLLSKKPHIVVATPGRMKDHLENTKGFNLNHLKYLVIDEADKMLEYDYEHDLLIILSRIPRNRITSLWSATMTTKVEQLQKASLNDPVKLEVDSRSTTVDTLKQQYIFIPYTQKQLYLSHVISLLSSKLSSFLVFVEACHLVRKLCLMLRILGIRALPLYGQMIQEKRQLSLDRFRSGVIKVLVCTDVASRGLDIEHVDCVINYTLPLSVKDYIHRVGRTARAGRPGLAINFVTQYDVLQILKIEKVIGFKMPEFTVNESEAIIMQDRVNEAFSEAVRQCKASEERKNRKIAAAGEKGHPRPENSYKGNKTKGKQMQKGKGSSKNKGYGNKKQSKQRN